MIRTYAYRLYPSKPQERLMFRTLETCRLFYNSLLEERRDAWQNEQRSVGKYEQMRRIKIYRAQNSYAKRVHSHVLQVAVSDLDKAFQAFFRRIKAGKTPGYPRFKGRDRFKSFGFKEYRNGFKIDGRRLRLFGIGRVAVRWHRQIEGKVKTLRVKHKAGKWYAYCACEVEPKPLPATGKTVGIDVGIHHLLATSDGQVYENPRWYREGQARLRRIQRKVSRRKKGSNRRRKAVLELQCAHEHISSQRMDYIRKTVLELVCNYDTIAIEDLRINNMVRNHYLSKSILDAGWGYFKRHLIGKAEEAGREVVKVNPAYTSKTCSDCGAIFANLKLSDRTVKCGCGLRLDRDVNAAINILHRAGHARQALTWGNGSCVA